MGGRRGIEARGRRLAADLGAEANFGGDWVKVGGVKGFVDFTASFFLSAMSVILLIAIPGAISTKSAAWYSTGR